MKKKDSSTSRLLTGLSLTAAVMAVLASCAAPGTSTTASKTNRTGDEVEARSFAITYGGKVVGRMQYPGVVEFYDKSGRTVSQWFGTQAFKDTPSLQFTGSSGAGLRVDMVGGAEGPKIELRGANGYPRGALKGTANGSELRLTDDVGHERLRLIVDRKTGGRIEFVNASGQVVKTIGETSSP